MVVPAIPASEDLRLETLRKLGVLDTPFEAAFDSRTEAAAKICETPIALVSLVDQSRQWFKSNVGLHGVSETPRELAFCAHAIHGDALFQVSDTLLDQRFVNHPFVVGDPKIRFYAGVPLRMSNGQRVGTLCVIDLKPKKLTPLQQEVLSSLARSIVRLLEKVH
jgi:diguanylate cyclase